MEIRNKLKKGIYLVVDPSMEESILLDKIEQVLLEKIVALQIWDNFKPGENIPRLLEKICKLCHSKDIPVFINNRWEFLTETSLDGIHFDEIPEDILSIRSRAGKPFLCGLTCNNDLSCADWAENNNFDYISFCSVFPSSTSNSCELVDFETIKKARQHFTLPIFLAGGINLENLEKLNEVEYDGIAVISGIMKTENPGKTTQNYIKKLKL